METTIINHLTDHLGLASAKAATLYRHIYPLLNHPDPEQAWHIISSHLAAYPFPIHLYFFSLLFPQWRDHPEQAPAWLPTEELKKHANLACYMHELGITNRKDFHQWTTKHYQYFWQQMIKKLHIVFKHPPTQVCDLKKGLTSPEWLPGATLNISDSCFIANPTKTAVIFQDKNKHIKTLSYQALHHLVNRIANSLKQCGLQAGDSIGIAMPMTVEAVAIYLAIIKMGCIVVSIADSFSSTEMATRLQIAKAKAIFTQDNIWRNNKKHPLYERVTAANAPPAIVLPSKESISLSLLGN